MLVSCLHVRRPKKKRFDEPDICKYYICGFCPFEEFRRTKNDCGDCPSVHDEDCKAQWEALDDREKERYGYERELMRKIEKFQGDLRRRIEVNTERLAATQQPLYLANDQTALDRMRKEIDELLAKAATLGEEGDVDAAEAATKEADAIRDKMAVLERQADSRSGNNAVRGLVQSVCPVSGLIINDEESRLRDHHSGRNYNSWKKLHEVYAALKEKMAQREGDRRGGGSVRDYHGHRDREYRDHRDRDRDRRYHPDRHRSRDGERDRGYRERDRERDRHRRHRSRSYERRRRSRSRSRSRDRARGGREAPRENGDRARRVEAGSPEEGEAPQEAYAPQQQ